MDKKESETRTNIQKMQGELDVRFTKAVITFRDGDISSALKEATALVDAEFNHAYSLLGTIYEKAGSPNCVTDYQKALFYYQMGVDKAGAVESWLGLGRLYYFGKGVPQSYEKAFEYYSTVVEDIDNPVAQLMLGRMYLNGEGTEKDYIRARTYLEDAKNRDYVFAYSYLGTLEMRERRYLRAMRNRLYATWTAIILTIFRPFDPRLRRI